MVNIRLALIGKRPKLAFPRLAEAGAAEPAGRREVHFADTHKAVPCPVYRRDALPTGQILSGPAIVTQRDSTTIVLPDQEGRVDPSGVIRVSSKRRLRP